MRCLYDGFKDGLFDVLNLGLWYYIAILIPTYCMKYVERQDEMQSLYIDTNESQLLGALGRSCLRPSDRQRHPSSAIVSFQLRPHLLPTTLSYIFKAHS